MATEAGPSNAAAEEALDEEEFEEEAPFPEPEYKSMLLADLMGLAAEFEAAAMLEECEQWPALAACDSRCRVPRAC